MLKNSVVVIPDISDEKQVCDFLAQTASVLRRDNTVYVLKYFALPRILPFRRFAWINQLNRILYLWFFQLYLLVRHPSAKAFYWWIFFPQLSPISKIKLPGWQLIFDIVDYHFSPLESVQRQLENQKNELLQRADYVFSISHALKNLYQSRSSKEIKMVSQGFAFQDFALRNEPTKLKLPHDKPMIGFIGQMSERLDLKLLHELIKRNQQWNFVFIGPKHHEPNVSFHFDEHKIDELFTYKNAFYYPSQPKNTMRSIIKQFGVCLIPYDVSHDFNRYSYPMKTFEYFYVGKPIISTKIEELKRFPTLIYTASSADGFAEMIKNALMKPWPKELKLKQLKLAEENSWENKLEEISVCLILGKI